MPRSTPPPAPAGFDLGALWTALDRERAARGLTWAAATREIDGGIAPSTIAGLRTGTVAEGDGVLQMLRWLRRTPESFVPRLADGDAERYRLPEVGAGRTLRWDAAALHAALDARRAARGLTWAAVAREVGGCTPAMLASLARGGRVGVPGVLRLTRWLERPAAEFTWAAPR